jgi:hypothetical protein
MFCCPSRGIVDCRALIAPIGKIEPGRLLEFRADATGATAVQLHRAERCAAITRETSEPFASRDTFHYVRINPVLDGGLANRGEHSSRVALAGLMVSAAVVGNAVRSRRETISRGN